MAGLGIVAAIIFVVATFMMITGICLGIMVWMNHNCSLRWLRVSYFLLGGSLALAVGSCILFLCV